METKLGEMFSDAIERGSLDLVKALLPLRPKLDYKNNKGTPLEFAIERSQDAIVEHLLTLPKIPVPSPKLTSGLLRNIARFAKLINLEASFEADIFKFAYFGQLAALQQIESNKALSVQDSHERTAIFYAAAGGDLPTIQWLMSKPSQLPSLKDSHNYTPIDYAAWNGRLNVVQFFFDHLFSPVNGTDYFINALHCAAEKGHLEIVGLLVDVKKVSYIKENTERKTLIETALHSGQLAVAKWLVNEKKVSLHNCRELPDVASYGHLSTVQWLVTDHYLPLDQKGSGENTALNNASYNGHLELMTWLVRQGADVGKINAGDGTPLDNTLTHSSTAASILLADRGATLNKKINNQSEKCNKSSIVYIRSAPNNFIRRFKDIQDKIRGNQLLCVDVAGNWLTEPQIEELIAAVKNSSVVEECYFGIQVQKTSAPNRAYLSTRFTLSTCFHATTEEDVYKVLYLSYPSSPLRSLGNALHIAVLTNQIKLLQSLTQMLPIKFYFEIDNNGRTPGDLAHHLSRPHCVQILNHMEKNKLPLKLKLSSNKSLDSEILKQCEVSQTNHVFLWKVWDCVYRLFLCKPIFRRKNAELRSFTQLSPFNISTDNLITKKEGLQRQLAIFNDRGVQQEVIFALEELIRYFDLIIKEPNNLFSTMIMGVNFGPYTLTTTENSLPSPLSNTILKGTQLSYSNTIYFEQMPDNFDEVLLLNCMANALLLNCEMAAFYPIKIINSDGETYIYNASHASNPILLLAQVLKKYPAQYQCISATTFIAAVLLELLFRKANIHYDIHCYVTDDANGQPATIEPAKFTTLETNDSFQTLFFLPQMQQLIDKDYLSQLSKKGPEIILLDWLKQLAQQSKIYATLIAQGKLSKTECIQLKLPIRFNAKMLPTLHSQLIHIFDLIKKSTSLTFRTLFCLVAPELANYYDTINVSGTYTNKITIPATDNNPTWIEKNESIDKCFIKLLHIIDSKMRKDHLDNNLYQSLHEAHQTFYPYRSLLATALINNCDALLEQLLKSQIFDINSIDYEGYTLLHHAALLNLPKMVAILLKYNANPAILDYQQETAWKIAEKRSHETIAFMLHPANLKPQAFQWKLAKPSPTKHQATHTFCSRPLKLK